MRYGIIGSGKITESFLEAASRVPGFALTAVYSRSLERARERAARCGARYAFDDLSDLASCEAVDAVYIASPNCFHCAQSLLMLSRGKHVLCEKPAASNGRELSLMLDTAKQNNVILLEAVRNVLSPSLGIIQSQLPKLGVIRRVSLVYNQYSSRYDRFRQGIVDNAFDPSLSNGALMDIGVYCIALLIALFGEPRAISSHGVRLQNGIDGQGAILAQYEGMIAELSYSKISDAALPSVIQGEEGSLILPHITVGKTVELRLRSGEAEIIPCEPLDNNITHEIEAFERFAQEGTGHEHYNLISWQTMSMLDEARRQQHIVFPAD